MAEEHTEGLILDVTPGHEAFEQAFLETLGHPVLVCHGPGGHVCPRANVVWVFRMPTVTSRPSFFTSRTSRS